MANMKHFKVETEWSGYSRGVATYEFWAVDEEEARERYGEGLRVEYRVVRDDTEREILEITEID